jgi:hypothetical protein
MTTANASRPAARGLAANELVRSLGHAMDNFINSLLAFKHDAAVMRGTLVWLSFMVLALFLVVSSRSLDDWGGLLLNFLGAILAPSVPLPNGESSSKAILDLIFALLGNPEVWGHLVALYAPYWLMSRIAAIYLADIFEKEDSVARTFISQAAFGTDYNTVHIREGKIVEADQNSPIVQIGGPGYVMVELDSAALFERPDGTSHVIPPTVGEWRGKKVIEGFERIRQAADLRDMLGSQEVGARSRDGIPVIAKDIQYSYSIYRGENPVKTLQTPYPFIEKAVESLAYRLPRPVKPGVPPSAKPDWLSPLPGKVAGPVQLELGSFVSRHGLSEFLSSIGEPEEAALRSRESQLDKLGQQLSGRNGNNVGEILFKPAVFTSRSSITAMFYDEAGFKKRAADRGFQINWIGVGTWVTPAEIIPANHLEAWKISRENFLRSAPEEIEHLREETRLEWHLQLIQTIAINKFYMGPSQASETELVDSIISDYYDTIQSALEIYEREGKDLPQMLLEAMTALNEVRGINRRWIGDG